jgi:hypothetical protein
VTATARAAAAMGLPITGLILVAPEHADASTGTNAHELGVVSEVLLLAALPRAAVEALAEREDLALLVRSLLRPKA